MKAKMVKFCTCTMAACFLMITGTVQASAGEEPAIKEGLQIVESESFEETEGVLPEAADDSYNEQMDFLTQSSETSKTDQSKVRSAKQISGNIYWEIAGDTLTISPVENTNGKMPNYRDPNVSIGIPEISSDYWNRALSPWNENGDNTTVRKIVIQEGVSNIGQNAFGYLNSLQDISIADSVRRIESLAFISCKELQKIVIPRNVNYLGQYLFRDCSQLKDIRILAKVRKLDYTLADCTGLTEVTLPPQVESLYHTFEGCVNLRRIAIPLKVKKLIGTFIGCSKMESIHIPKNIKSIGTSAFLACTSLRKVKLSNNIINIGDRSFAGCTSLKEVTLPVGIKKINKNTFINCSNLKSITIKSKVLKVVENNAIKGINKKAVIMLPKNKYKAYKNLFSPKTGFQKKTMKIKGI